MSGVVRLLKSVSMDDVADVGGKAASLGEMIQAGINVPPGFVVTTQAGGAMTPELEQQIYEAFDKLGEQFVAVRSSAVAEDSSDASWAGQLETYLNVTRDNLIESVQKCWSSITSERAKVYASEKGVEASTADVGVVVQAMIQSDVAGVAFSANPITNNRDEIMIEACLGIGEALVSGQVTPDNYIVSKSGEIKDVYMSEQTRQLVKSESGVDWVELGEEGGEQKISNEQIIELAEQIKRVESHYGFPVDIEWVIKDGELFIMQSRPITTLVDDAEDILQGSVYVPTITRPATVQRDEIVRYTANAVEAVDFISVPHDGRNRTYYLESQGAKRLLDKCVDRVSSKQSFDDHLASYESVVEQSNELRKLTSSDPRNYKDVFTKYDSFLSDLSWFLFVGVAVDRVIYPKFEEAIKERYPESSDQIIATVTTQRQLTDYQQFRIKICELVANGSKSDDSDVLITKLTEQFKHINEYSFVEKLLSLEDINRIISDMTAEEARAELEAIHASMISDGDWEATIALIPDEQLQHEALIINTYMWLRTDRIDRLTYVQVGMREVFDSIANAISDVDGNTWTVEHIANLTRLEIDDFIEAKVIPDFESVSSRMNQQYLFTAIGGHNELDLDQDSVARTKKQLSPETTKQEESIFQDGFVAFKGKVSGRVVKVRKFDDLEKVEEGDILVAVVTMPDYTSAMKRAAGIITAEGGVTSHAAIVARELKKPCVIGARDCMDVLDEGVIVQIDTSDGKASISLVASELTFQKASKGAQW